MEAIKGKDEAGHKDLTTLYSPKRQWIPKSDVAALTFLCRERSQKVNKLPNGTVILVPRSVHSYKREARRQ